MPRFFLQAAYDASIATIPLTALFPQSVVLHKLKAQLRDAPVLLTCSTTGLLDVVPYPCDTQGVTIPVSELVAYNQTHTFIEEIHCFCGLSQGSPGPVRVFKASSPLSDHFGCVCIGCMDWKPACDGAPARGCSYFVNVTRRIVNSTFTADGTPLKMYPLRNSVPIITPTPVQPMLPPPVLTSAPPFNLPPRLPITPPPGPARLLSPLGLTPGLLYDADRLYSPPPPDKALCPVKDRSAWPDPVEAEETILSLINPVSPGTSYAKLVSSLGNCFLCGRVMALHLVLNHYCLPLPGESASLPGRGNKIYGMRVPFGIGLPTSAPNAGVGTSAPRQEVSSMGPSLCGPASSIKTEIVDDDGDDSEGITPLNSRRTYKRVLVPSHLEKQERWLNHYYHQLEALRPGLAHAIGTGEPRGLDGPIMITGWDELYIGPPSHKRKYFAQPSTSEPEEACDRDSSSEHHDSPCGKGKGVKRLRRMGESSGEGMGGEGSGNGVDVGGSADGSCNAAVKMEDVEESRPLIGHEELFITKDGKQVMLINLTDD